MGSVTNKVIVPKEVAGILKMLRSCGWRGEDVVAAVFGTDDYSDHPLVREINKLRSWPQAKDELMSALVNGYEVEKSAEELQAERQAAVREYYEWLSEREERYCYRNVPSVEVRYSGMKTAVRTTLNRLGIDIEGVNA